MTFEQYWNVFIKDNMACLNYKNDFKKVWLAAQNEILKDTIGKLDYVKKQAD